MKNTRTDVTKGDKFITAGKLEMTVVTFWEAAFTESFKVTVEEGEIFEAILDSTQISTGFYCDPASKRDFPERYFKSAPEDQLAYAGYAVLIMKKEIGGKIKVLKDANSLWQDS